MRKRYTAEINFHCRKLKSHRYWDHRFYNRGLRKFIGLGIVNLNNIMNFTNREINDKNLENWKNLIKEKKNLRSSFFFVSKIEKNKLRNI